MFGNDRHIRFLFSPGKDIGPFFAHIENGEQTETELNASIELLKKANRDIAETRRAAFNLMEDAVRAKESLEVTQYRMRKQKDAFQSVINGASLEESLNIIAGLAIEETGARTAFYLADENNAFLHPAWGVGNMPKGYLQQIDGFVIGKDSLAGLATTTGLPVITEDVLKEPLWKQWVYIAEKFNFRGCWSFPILSREKKAIGAFAMYFFRPRKASVDEIALAELVAQTAAIIISYHILERLRSSTEHALRKSEEKLRNLNIYLEQEVRQRSSALVRQHEILNQAESIAQSGSWEYDLKTKQFVWSDGMYQLFGLSNGQPVQPEIYLKYALNDDRAIAEHIVHCIRESFTPFEETLRIKIGGYHRLLRVKALPLKNEREEPEKMQGVNLDITEMKLSEAEIARLNASLSEMNQELRMANTELQYSNDKVTRLNESILDVNEELNSVNSELKKFSSVTANNYTDALHNVYTNLEFIITSDARYLSNTSRARLRRAQAAIQRMKLLTNDIHSYLQLYDVIIKMQLTDLNGIVQGVLISLKTKIEESNAKITVAELPQALVDPELFSRLMTELIGNAIKFRKPDADPVIRIGYAMIDAAKTSLYKFRQPSIIIQVADNGMGFEMTDKIFELFTQLEEHGKPKGAGMGLPICKKIMEMHGGFIHAESEPGKGSTFTCHFLPPPRPFA